MPPEIYRRVDQGSQEIEPTLKTQILFFGQGRDMEQVCGQLVTLGEHPVARIRVDQTDEILHDLYPQEFPEGLTPIILNGTYEARKKYQQPILFLNDTASFDIFRQQYPEINIVGFAGYSFGTVTAAYASGAIKDEADALRFVVGRSRITAENNKENPGKLKSFAINHADERLREIQEEFGSEIAIKTSNRFTVVGGSFEAVDLTAQKAESLGIKTYEIPYNDAAYHTSLMGKAVPSLRELLKSIKMQSPHSTITTNNARTINRVGQTRSELATHIADMSDWQSTAYSIVSARNNEQLIEIGSPNGILSSHLERDLQDQYPTIKRGDLRKTILKVDIGATAALAIGAFLRLRAIRGNEPS